MNVVDRPSHCAKSGARPDSISPRRGGRTRRTEQVQLERTGARRRWLVFVAVAVVAVAAAACLPPPTTTSTTTSTTTTTTPPPTPICGAGESAAATALAGTGDDSGTLANQY